MISPACATPQQEQTYGDRKCFQSQKSRAPLERQRMFCVFWCAFCHSCHVCSVFPRAHDTSEARARRPEPHRRPTTEAAAVRTAAARRGSATESDRSTPVAEREKQRAPLVEKEQRLLVSARVGNFCACQSARGVSMGVSGQMTEERKLAPSSKDVPNAESGRSREVTVAAAQASLTRPLLTLCAALGR